jgi:toxin ParE1/3/4
MAVFWTEEAIAGLARIRDYYLDRGAPKMAQYMGLLVLEMGNALDSLPHCGRPGRVTGTRELLVPGTPFLLAYRADGPRPVILAVKHEAQAWPARFDGAA